MSYENMMYISIGISIVMFVLSVILFIQLNIPRVIGGLSGYSARKEIEKIREQNLQSGKKGYQTSPVNRARGKVTTPLGQKGSSGRLSQMTSELSRVINKTELLAPRPAQGEAAQTSLLGASATNETTMLNVPTSNETTMLAGADPNATILGVAEPNATTVLGYNAAATTAAPEYNANPQLQGFAFEIEVDLAVTHTNEVIK